MSRLGVFWLLCLLHAFLPGAPTAGAAEPAPHEALVKKYSGRPTHQDKEVETFLKALPSFAEDKATADEKKKRIQAAAALLKPYLDKTFACCEGHQYTFNLKDGLLGTPNIVVDTNEQVFDLDLTGNGIEFSRGDAKAFSFRPLLVGKDTLVMEIPNTVRETEDKVPLRKFALVHLYEEEGRKRMKLTKVGLYRGKLILESSDDLEESKALACRKAWFNAPNVRELKVEKDFAPVFASLKGQGPQVFLATDERSEHKAIADLDKLLAVRAKPIPAVLEYRRRRGELETKQKRALDEAAALEAQLDDQHPTTARRAKLAKELEELKDKLKPGSTARDRVAEYRHSLAKAVDSYVDQLEKMLGKRPSDAEAFDADFLKNLRLHDGFFGAVTDSAQKQRMKEEAVAKLQLLLRDVNTTRRGLSEAEEAAAHFTLGDRVSQARVQEIEQALRENPPVLAITDPELHGNLLESAKHSGAFLADELALLEKKHLAMVKKLGLPVEDGAAVVVVPSKPSWLDPLAHGIAALQGRQLTSYDLQYRTGPHFDEEGTATVVILRDPKGKRSSVWVQPTSKISSPDFWLNSAIRGVEMHGDEPKVSRTLPPLKSGVRDLTLTHKRLDAMDSGTTKAKDLKSFGAMSEWFQKTGLLPKSAAAKLGDITIVYSPALARLFPRGAVAAANTRDFLLSYLKTELPGAVTERMLLERLGPDVIVSLYPPEVLEEEFPETLAHELLHEIDRRFRPITNIGSTARQMKALDDIFPTIVPDLMRADRLSPSYQRAYDKFLKELPEGEVAASPLSKEEIDERLRAEFEKKRFGEDGKAFEGASRKHWVYLNTPAEKAAFAVEIAYMRDVLKLPYQKVRERMTRVAGGHKKDLERLTAYEQMVFREMYEERKLEKLLDKYRADAARLSRVPPAEKATGK